MNWILSLLETIKPHLAGLGLLVTWGGIVWIYLQRRIDFHRKRIDRINMSLNYVQDGRLAMRTLLETTPREVWLNEYGLKLVGAAARRTTTHQPFVVLSNANDMTFVKQAIKNALSECFAHAYLAHALGVPTRKATFLFALTYERYKSIRELKFRVVVIEEKTLQAEFGPDVHMPDVLKQRHVDRVEVLRKMAVLAAKSGTLVEGADVLERVELGVFDKS